MTSARPPLSSVYLDRQRVGLLGDPRPRVSQILAASGTDPEGLQVRRDGQALPLDEVIDRTAEPTVPVHLVLAADPSSRSREHFVAFPNPGSPLPRRR